MVREWDMSRSVRSWRLIKSPLCSPIREELPKHVIPDPTAGPLRFRLTDATEPRVAQGLPLELFFRLHEQRYQMYWQLTSLQGFEERRERLAVIERARAGREATTIDLVALVSSSLR